MSVNEAAMRIGRAASQNTSGGIIGKLAIGPNQRARSQYPTRAATNN